jgi:hypothetical protein
VTTSFSSVLIQRHIHTQTHSTNIMTHPSARAAASAIQQQQTPHLHSLHPNHAASFAIANPLVYPGSSVALPQLPSGPLARPQEWATPPGPTFWPPQQDTRARAFATPPPARVQHRKRHKVATSCNRCRSNKVPPPNIGTFCLFLEETA